MPSHYQNTAAAIAASENVVRGPWKGRRSFERHHSLVTLPDNAVALRPAPEPKLDPMPTWHLMSGAIFCALMDEGAKNPAIRAVYEATLDKLRPLTKHEDERVQTNAMAALNAAFIRPYI